MSEQSTTISIPLVVEQQFKITDGSSYNAKHIFTVKRITGPTGNRMFDCDVTDLNGKRLTYTSHCWPEIALQIHARKGQLLARKVAVPAVESSGIVRTRLTGMIDQKGEV